MWGIRTLGKIEERRKTMSKKCKRKVVAILFFVLFFSCFLSTREIEAKTIPNVIDFYGKRVLAIRVNAPRIKIIEGTTQKLFYEVVPSTAKNTKVTFSSSDKKIVSVDSRGYIKGLTAGRAVVTIASTDGSGVKMRVIVEVTKKKQDVKTIAHRGLVIHAPENSMEAFRSAIEQNFWGIEFDVQATKDHQLVVMHDSDLARMTNGTGYIKDYNRWELYRFKIDSGKNVKQLPTQRIPSLSEVLNLCQQSSVVPVIELKEVQVSELPTLLNTLRKYDMEEKAVIISFHMELLEWLRNHSDCLSLQWIEKRMSTKNINECRKRQMDIDSKLYSITRQKIEYAHANDVRVNSWTIIKEEDYKRMISDGVDFITMDIVPIS